MATIKLELHVPDWTVVQLKQAVRDIDALDDECPIAVEHVQASDVLHYFFDGQLGLDGRTDAEGHLIWAVNEMTD